MSAYADTSVLVSLYVLDANSARAAARIISVPRPILLTPLNEVEVTNAFYLRLFRREIDSVKLRLARSLFQEDIENGIFEVRALSSAVFHWVGVNCDGSKVMGSVLWLCISSLHSPH